MSMLLMVAVIKASLAVICYDCSCSGEDCNATSCQDPFSPSDSTETCDGDLCAAQKVINCQFTYTNYFSFNTFIFLKKCSYPLQNRWPT